MAAALVGSGAAPHGDDVISLEPNSGNVPFGTSRIKLNPDILGGIELPVLSVAPLYEGLEKKSVQFAFPDDLSTRPLKAIYRLNDTDGDTEMVELLKFPVAVSLMGEMYRPHVAERALGLQTMLDRAASLVGKVRFFEFYRPRNLARIEQSARTLIEHFKSLD
jgi:hypothetical protein